MLTEQIFDNFFRNSINSYKITYFDPCTGECVIGKCDNSVNTNCCITINNTPLTSNPSSTGNPFKNQIVIGPTGNIYFVDNLGNSILIKEIIASPTITANNGLTKELNNIKLGGDLVEDTSIKGLDSFKLLFEDLTRFDLLNFGNNIEYRFVASSSSLASNYWLVSNNDSTSATYQVYNKISLNPSFGLSLTSGKSSDTSTIQLISSGSQFGITSASSDGVISSGILTDKETTSLIGANNPVIGGVFTDKKEIGVTKDTIFQKNINLGYQPYVMTTDYSVSNSDTKKPIEVSYSGASLGTIKVVTSSSLTPDLEDGLVLFNNAIGIDYTLPPATLNKIVELKGMGVSSINLIPPVYEDFGKTSSISILYSVLNSSYSNPSYLKLWNDGTDWFVISKS